MPTKANPENPVNPVYFRSFNESKGRAAEATRPAYPTCKDPPPEGAAMNNSSLCSFGVLCFTS
jgi:hypothetical protein